MVRISLMLVLLIAGFATSIDYFHRCRPMVLETDQCRQLAEKAPDVEKMLEYLVAYEAGLRKHGLGAEKTQLPSLKLKRASGYSHYSGALLKR